MDIRISSGSNVWHPPFHHPDLPRGPAWLTMMPTAMMSAGVYLRHPPNPEQLPPTTVADLTAVPEVLLRDLYDSRPAEPLFWVPRGRRSAVVGLVAGQAHRGQRFARTGR
jgi:hypothetical protein